MTDLDTALELFRDIREEYHLASSAPEIDTEAEARMRLVDRILFDCLQWPRNARLELATDDDRLDYLLRDTDNRNWVVVEAKRPSVRLANPEGQGKDGTLAFKLAGPALKLSDGGAWAVFHEQIVRYGSRQGTSLGIATNGLQWVGAAVPSASGKSLDEERAVVFGSLEAIEDQFEHFYNYFSLPGVRSRILDRRLHQEGAWVLRTCSRPKRVVRDPMPLRVPENADGYYQELERALNIVFTPIEDNPFVIEHCFVESRESKDSDDRLARLTELLTEFIAEAPRQYADRVEEDATRLRDDLALAQPSHGTLAVLTGEFSAGKTSFIRRFYAFKLPPDRRKLVRLIHVRFDEMQDLYDERAVATAIARACEAEVFSGDSANQGQFLDLYEKEWSRHKTMFGDSDDQKRSFIASRIADQEKEPLAYVERLMRLSVQRHRRLPCLVLDGFDHLPCNLQAFILNASATLYRNTFALITVVMDDATIWRLRRSGGEERFSNHVTLRLWLPRPKVGDVLKNRFNFLRQLFSEADEKAAGRPTRTTIGRGLHWTLKPDRVASFLRDSLLFENDTVRRWIEQLANYDIRAVLGICKTLILAPALKKEKVFSGFVTGSFESLSEGELVRALIKPRHENYKSDPGGFVHNIYNFGYEHKYVPLGPLFVLLFLESKRRVDKANTEEVQGFLSMRELVDDCEQYLRIPGEMVRHIVGWLHARSLAQSYDPSQKEPTHLGDRFKITPRGRVHIEWALHNWNYMREMGEVDAICDDEVSAEMSKVALRHKNWSDEAEWKKTTRAFAHQYIGYLANPYSSATPGLPHDRLYVAEAYQALSSQWLGS